MATFGWSYKSNVSGVKRPKEVKRNVEDWQKDREDVKIPLHRQSHSAESVGAGMKRRRYHPRAKIFVGNLNKDTKPVTLAEYFSFFGEIAYMKIVKDRETGISRGFAFITYAEVQEAEKAVRWCRGNHPRVDGKEIKVGFAERRFGPAPKHSSILSANSSLKERRETHTLYWEYKWTQDPQSEVYGPYETGLMLQWYKMGYFSAGCFVRQVHHVSTNQDYTTQGSQNINKSLHTVPSLVDAYSSSSDDEETPNKRPKVETTQHQSEDYLENYEMKENTESINKELEVEDGTNGQNSEQELWKYVTKNDAKINDEDDNLLKNESEHEKKIDEHQVQTSQNDDYLPKNGNEKDLSESDCVESSDETIRKYDNLYKTGPESDKSIEETSEQTSTELEHLSPNDNDNEFINESNGNDENLHSWYQKDEDGYKTSDMFGRDSSSEDEDYDFIDQQLSENEFVHINEIDFSMFP